MPAKINDGLTNVQRYLNKDDNREKRNDHVQSMETNR